MSIIRVGLAETKNFSEGYDAIFGKANKSEKKAEQPKSVKKPVAKKKAKKK